VLLVVGVLVSMGAGCAPGARRGYAALGGIPRGDTTIRAIWVTRWDYRTPGDVVAIMDNARSAGFNTVLFQVRGNGTAFYRSRFEPWSEELGGRDPGFDPLLVACREAHRRGLALHAWVNVMPGWRGKGPPADRRQLYHAHPEWFWMDEHGRRQPFGWYQSLNPCLPEVRGYLVAVMREIVRGYPVDGLHLDYIRYPNEWNSSWPQGARVPDYPRDARTRALFRKDTGRAAHQSPQAWDEWRARQLTRLVWQIRTMMRQARPGTWLTAAVKADPSDGLRLHYQDTRRWMADGLVDAVYPMNYATDPATFDRRTTLWRGAPVPVVMGIQFDRRDPSLVVQQLGRTRSAGGHFAAFAYNSLFERRDPRGRPLVDDQSASREALRTRLVTERRLAGGR
jgi:uncharacterized lipoprotein YddW (UPF0748 family)